MSHDASGSAAHDRTSSTNPEQHPTPKRLQPRRAHHDSSNLADDDPADSFARRLDVLLEGVVQKFEQRLDDLLSGQAQHQTPRYADAKNNPLGKARAFLDAGRRGDFPTFKRSREIVARWSDVEQYIERRGSQSHNATSVNDDLELLRKAGVPLGGDSSAPPSPQGIARSRRRG
jgi:hypothetical protein